MKKLFIKIRRWILWKLHITFFNNAFYRTSIKALIWNEDKTKFVIVKESNGTLELPGGGLDWGESPQEDITRELREEMGLEAVMVSLAPSYYFTDIREGKYWYANVVYEVAVKDFNITPSDECVEIVFVTPQEALTYPSAFKNVRILAKQMLEKIEAREKGSLGN